jgi:hypothetical protein
MSTRLCLIRDFVQLAAGPDVSQGEGDPNRENSHSYTKLAFHSKGRAVLRAVAKELGLQSGSYDIRSNLGGVGVSGEITLHGESIYISFSQSCCGDVFMYRSCKGRKDCTGGANHWMQWEALYDLPAACEKFKAVMNGSL